MSRVTTAQASPSCRWLSASCAAPGANSPARAVAAPPARMARAALGGRRFIWSLLSCNGWRGRARRGGARPCPMSILHDHGHVAAAGLVHIRRVVAAELGHPGDVAAPALCGDGGIAAALLAGDGAVVAPRLPGHRIVQPPRLGDRGA